MTKLQKTKEICIALLLMGLGVGLLFMPGDDGFDMVLLILAFWFGIIALGSLSFYFYMARFMVGGRVSLYKGIILFDLSALTGSLTDVPHYYVLFYLIGLHAFQGLIRILRAFESRRYGASSYRLKLLHGILDLIVAIVCIVFIRHIRTAVLIYGLGLIYSSIFRIASALRKKKLIFIP